MGRVVSTLARSAPLVLALVTTQAHGKEPSRYMYWEGCEGDCRIYWMMPGSGERSLVPPRPLVAAPSWQPPDCSDGMALAGWVAVEVTVDAKGLLAMSRRGVVMTARDPAGADPAEQALQGWRFAPGTRAGVPVAWDGVISIRLERCWPGAGSRVVDDNRPWSPLGAQSEPDLAPRIQETPVTVSPMR